MPLYQFYLAASLLGTPSVSKNERRKISSSYFFLRLTSFQIEKEISLFIFVQIRDYIYL